MVYDSALEESLTIIVLKVAALLNLLIKDLANPFVESGSQSVSAADP